MKKIFLLVISLIVIVTNSLAQLELDKKAMVYMEILDRVPKILTIETDGTVTYTETREEKRHEKIIVPKEKIESLKEFLLENKIFEIDTWITMGAFDEVLYEITININGKTKSIRSGRQDQKINKIIDRILELSPITIEIEGFA